MSRRADPNRPAVERPMRLFWDDPQAALLVLLLAFGPALVPLVPCLALALWARLRVAQAISASEPPATIDGATLAAAILEAGGATDATVVRSTRAPADFYDPARREVRLSPGTHSGRTVGALAVAAREAGHALQHARGVPMLRLRAPLVLAIRLGAGVAWMTLLAGALMTSPGLFGRGALLLAAVVVAFLILHPIERDANRRARSALALAGLDGAGADPTAFQRALDASAWSDLAATLPLPRSRPRSG